MLRQALIAAGGKGTRLGALAKKYGNKSMVPINGKPILLYTIQWLKDAGIQEVIVSVNYAEQYEVIRDLLAHEPGVRVIRNNFRQSSAQSIPTARHLLDARFLFVYGHAPVPVEHIRLMDTASHGHVVASAYPTTSQGAGRKPVAINENGYVVLNEEGSLFIEPPHILNTEFVRILAKTGSWKESFRRYKKHIFGVRANHPSEFHYPKDFERFKRIMMMKLKGG